MMSNKWILKYLNREKLWTIKLVIKMLKKSTIVMYSLELLLVAELKVTKAF